MVQVDVILDKMKEVRKVADNHPYYSKLGLDSHKSYNDAVIDEFLRSNGDFNRKVIREELERLLIKHHIVMDQSNTKEVTNVQSQ